MIVSGSQDGVRIWQFQGTAIAAFTDSPVNSVAAGRLNGEDVLVSGGGDGMIRVWAMDQPRKRARRLTLRTMITTGSSVASVAVGRLNGQDVIVSGGTYDGIVQAWNLDGSPVGEPITVAPYQWGLSVAKGGDAPAHIGGSDEGL